MFISSKWDVKEPTHYSKRVGYEVSGVVAVLCESIASPHQLIAAKTQPAQSNKQTKKMTNDHTPFWIELLYCDITWYNAGPHFVRKNGY